MKVEILCVALLATLSAAMAGGCTEQDVCNDGDKNPFPDGDTCFLVEYPGGNTDYVSFASECMKKLDACDNHNKTEYYLSLYEMCDDSSSNSLTAPSKDDEVDALLKELEP